jgi:hypothetical protein
MNNSPFRHLFAAIVVLSVALHGSLDAQDDKLVLVSAEVVTPIIVFENAPPYIRQAADELAVYLEKISGAKPTVLIGEPDSLPKRGIWVGYQPILRTLFPAADFDFKHPEEILIAARGDHLVLAGRDRWDPDHLEVEGIDEKIVGRQSEYGTVNAVYTFLQDHLGVRWLWPGELGEDVPRRKRIALAPFEYRYHPQIRSRGGVFNFSSLSNKGYGRAHEWTRLQRLQLDSLGSSGGHGFGDWWVRYSKIHPEIFALQPDGTRSGHPQPRTAKLCQSNPLVGKLWLDGVAEQLAKDPNQTVFNGSPNDGWSSGHCVCAKCRAWDHPDGEPRLFHWYHHRETQPALSDRHVTFANRLAGLLRERYPDKDYRVMMLAYGHSRPAPVRAVPADNVIMMSVANFFGRTKLVDRGSTWGTTHRQQFEAWGKVTPHIMWRPNTGSPAGWWQGLPDVPIQQTIRDLKFVADNRCVGMYVDGIWEHWATQGPLLYVLAQLVWNPQQDAQAILKDYYIRAFGPAADSVAEFFNLMDRAREAHVERLGSSSGVFNLPKLYTADLLDRAEQLLQRAASAAQKGAGMHPQRVAFVSAGLAHTKLVIENATLMEGYWTRPDKQVAAQVRANWQAMEKIAADNPYAINWGPVRPSTPRMAGLHPDYPDPKKKKVRKVKDLDAN